MPGKRAKKPVSRAQARLFGAVAVEKSTKATGLTAEDAKLKLRGTKFTKLPARKKRKKA